MPDPRVQPLVEKLQENSKGYSAYLRLQELGARAEPAVTELMLLAKNRDAIAALFAIDTIGAVGTAARVALPTLCEIATTREKDVCVAAVQALRRMVTNNEIDEQVRCVATTLVDHPIPDVRSATAGLLAKIDNTNERATAVLLESMRSQHQMTRVGALEALGKMKIGDNSIVAKLAEFRLDPEELVRSVRWRGFDRQSQCLFPRCGHVTSCNKVPVPLLFCPFRYYHRSMRGTGRPSTRQRSMAAS